MTTSMPFRRYLPALARATSLAALCIATPVFAQETAAPPVETTSQSPEPTAQGGGDEILVTGSRVVRDGFQSPTPLTVLTAQDIQNSSPTNNLADFVNQIPAVAGSLRPANSRLAISSGLAGINALNLRALGEIRTLVLLDGRRSVGSSVTGLVDINTFPQALVKSVEIVTGGASAAYGSDAVAGVVNFALDKTYEGLKVTADSGITEYGDGFNYSFSVAGGTSFAGGRGHVLLSGEVAHRDGIFQVDRAWNARGRVVVTNPTYTNTNGQAQFLTLDRIGVANATPGGIILNSAGGTANRLRGLYFGPGGSVNQFNYGSFNSPALGGATAPTRTQGGDWQLNDQGRNIGLDADDDRHGVFGRVSYELADWITVFGEASYNWQKTLFNAGPQLSTTTTLRGDNAYLINTLGAARLAGITSVTLGTTAVDLPYRKNNSSREVQRYAIGAEGDFALFGNKAVWSAYGQYGETNAREQLRDIMNVTRMANATDAVFAPAGNALGVAAGTIVCRSTLTAPTNGCVPLNRLGIGVASQGAIDYALGDPYRDQTLKQTVAGINLSVVPFATWAGDVSVAVGGEYRKEEVSGNVPTEFQTGWSVGNFLPTFGSYDVKEAYLETVVPLGSGVEFNGAVRATDYSTSGYVTTWKVGTTWQPIDDIRFRVTRSRDIRAPNLSELFQAGTSRTNTLTDPFTGRTGVTFRETTTGNINLDPEVADLDQRRRGAATALPARLLVFGRRVPDRAEGRDRAVFRTGHHQSLLRGAAGILLGLWPRSGRRPRTVLPRQPVQLRTADGARDRPRRDLPRGAGRGVRQRAGQRHAEGAGHALYRQHHRCRRAERDPGRYRRATGRVQPAQMDLPVQRDLRHRQLRHHRHRARCRRRNLCEQLCRVFERLPGRASAQHRVAIPDDRQQPHRRRDLFRPQPDQQDRHGRRGEGRAVLQRDQRVQRRTDPAARNRAGGEQHLFGSAGPVVPHRHPDADAVGTGMTTTLIAALRGRSGRATS